MVFLVLNQIPFYLGWARQTDDPVGFAKLLKYLSDLDLNIVLLDYDIVRKFGNYKQVDIWWRGGSNNGNLVLSLIKFIRLSYEWRNVTARLMIINNDESRESQIIKDTQNVLDSMRIKAEIRIINNDSKLPVNQVIKNESANADLTFLGLADVQEGKELEFIERADYLYKDLGTIALVKASIILQRVTYRSIISLPHSHIVTVKLSFLLLILNMLFHSIALGNCLILPLQKYTHDNKRINTPKKYCNRWWIRRFSKAREVRF